MIKELLKPLEWIDKKPAEGESYRALAVSPVTRYVITDDGRRVKVIYHNFTEDEPAKTKPGFSSVVEAKAWVQGEHYPSKMAKWLNTDPLTETVNWFKEAKPEPTAKDRSCQIGVHYEEISEMADVLRDGMVWDECITTQAQYKACSAEHVERTETLSHDERIELLDALADQIVTAVGLACMMGFDIIGALKEVNASNWSKFVNGKAVTDENGKIIKGSDYFKPELDRFVGGSDEG